MTESVKTIKFNTKEDLDNWAKENIDNEEVLKAVLIPTFVPKKQEGV